MSRSLRLDALEACTRIRNASSAVHLWSRIRMPLACSMTARVCIAVRRPVTSSTASARAAALARAIAA